LEKQKMHNKNTFEKNSQQKKKKRVQKNTTQNKNRLKHRIVPMIKHKRKQMYTNSGQKWTISEETSLKSELKQGKTIKDIALSHNRSELAIQLRIASIVDNDLKLKKSLKAISQELKLSEEFLVTIMEKQKTFSTTKPEKQINSNTVTDLESRLDSIEKLCKAIYKKVKKL
jgi:hypothetical protein